MSVRLYIHSGQLQTGPLVVQGDEHHYLSKVRRLAVGDTVVLFDGQGSQARATILSISATQSELDLDAPLQVPQPDFQLTIAPALIKGERMDWGISKMVEMGVSCLRPCITERTIVRLPPARVKSRHDRYLSLAVAAARQSQNPHPPHIEPIVSFSDVVKSPEPGLKLIPCLSKEAVELTEALPEGDLRSATVLIGPEGGFTAKEITMAVESGFSPVSLGSRTLRAETACIALASILSFRYGDVGRR